MKPNKVSYFLYLSKNLNKLHLIDKTQNVLVRVFTLRTYALS